MLFRSFQLLLGRNLHGFGAFTSKGDHLQRPEAREVSSPPPRRDLTLSLFPCAHTPGRRPGTSRCHPRTQEFHLPAPRKGPDAGVACAETCGMAPLPPPTLRTPPAQETGQAAPLQFRGGWAGWRQPSALPTTPAVSFLRWGPSCRGHIPHTPPPPGWPPAHLHLQVLENSSTLATS